MRVTFAIVGLIIFTALSIYSFRPSKRREPATKTDWIVLTIGFVGLTICIDGALRP